MELSPLPLADLVLKEENGVVELDFLVLVESYLLVFEFAQFMHEFIQGWLDFIAGHVEEGDHNALDEVVEVELDSFVARDFVGIQLDLLDIN